MGTHTNSVHNENSLSGSAPFVKGGGCAVSRSWVSEVMSKAKEGHLNESRYKGDNAVPFLITRSKACPAP